MNWDKIRPYIIDFARPFTIYVSGLGCTVGAFIPHVDVDKLLVLAGLAGGVGYMHGKTKTDIAAINAKTDDGDKNGSN